MSKLALIGLVCCLLAPPAFGQSSMDHGSMAGMNMGGVDKELMASMARMTDAMPTKSAGSVDADFVIMMIPHHQAAIDMAKVQLEKGKDPELHKLSQEIISAQQKEIAQMKAWLVAHGIKAP